MEGQSSRLQRHLLLAYRSWATHQSAWKIRGQKHLLVKNGVVLGKIIEHFDKNTFILRDWCLQMGAGEDLYFHLFHVQIYVGVDLVSHVANLSCSSHLIQRT